MLGRLDVTTEELRIAGINALRLAAVGLAFAAYALLLDHDRLIAAATARRSVLAAALATRLVPTLERDAAGLVEALRGRGLAPEGLRGHAALLSPLLAGSLERGLNLAEAMEARGFGRPGRTRVPAPPWRLARLRRQSRSPSTAIAVGSAMALASVDRLTFSYPGAPPALRRGLASHRRRARSSCCSAPPARASRRSLRALAGLVPWFHGGRFEGRVEVAGRDTRRARPAELAGTVATVFQDPEDQVVLGRVEAEVAFGLENVGTPPDDDRRPRPQRARRRRRGAPGRPACDGALRRRAPARLPRLRARARAAAAPARRADLPARPRGRRGVPRARPRQRRRRRPLRAAPGDRAPLRRPRRLPRARPHPARRAAGRRARVARRASPRLDAAAK